MYRLLVFAVIFVILVEPSYAWMKNEKYWTKYPIGRDSHIDGSSDADGNDLDNGGGGNNQGGNNQGGNNQGGNNQGGNNQGGNYQGGNNQGENNQGGNNQGNNNQGGNNQGENNQGGNNQGGAGKETNEIAKDPDIAYNNFVNHAIAEDKYLYKYCQKYTRPAKVIYKTNHFILRIEIKDYTEDDIEVKAKHNILYIKGAVPEIDQRYGEDSENEIYDIRKLPAFLDVKKGSWTLKNGIFELTIPYKFQLNKEAPMTCGTEFSVNEEEVILPHGKVNDETGIDPSIIEEIFGGAKM